MIFQPLGNRLLVRRLPQKQKGLITLEPEASAMRIVEGEILAVGPDCEVQPGQKIMFNARWNDFTHGELKGSDCDGKGPLERPMPQWQWDKRDLHLITEGDIAGIISNCIP